MNETKKTIGVGIAAIALALIAFFLSKPGVTPDAFLDQGEAFFPEFTDPNIAATLEVFEYDANSGATIPFKVTFKDGKWTIPSHHDYPADAKDRLAKTAAGVIGIKKDDFRTDNVVEHEGCGVIDPLDDTSPTLDGRGKRITLKDAAGSVLADFIVGKPVPSREGFRFVRIPGEKRVYASRMDIELSTTFQDWINRDLLELASDQVGGITIQDYSIDERTGSVKTRDNVFLVLDNDGWRTKKAHKGYVIDSLKMDSLLTALDSLSIVGVRRKPAGLSASLSNSEKSTEMTTDNIRSLQSKGFFMTRDGSLRSNEGELQIHTFRGVTYSLRFGEIVYGSGEDVSAGTAASDKKDGGPGENRYLFVTTNFEEGDFPEPTSPLNTDYLDKPDSLWTEKDKQNKSKADLHSDWEQIVKFGRERSSELNGRFADWYYVISADSFNKLHLTRKDLERKLEKADKKS
jgi:Domain of unknown function (DUF4340)